MDEGQGEFPEMSSFTGGNMPAEFDALSDCSTSLDTLGMPAQSIEPFRLSSSELHEIAHCATQWSPGTFEKQIVLQLRRRYGVTFDRNGGSDIFHSLDNLEAGTGNTRHLRESSTH